MLKIGNAKITASEFTLYELAAATDNFNPDCLVGEGGFGRVYKGYIEGIKKVSHTNKSKTYFISSMVANIKIPLQMVLFDSGCGC